MRMLNLWRRVGLKWVWMGAMGVGIGSGCNPCALGIGGDCKDDSGSGGTGGPDQCGLPPDALDAGPGDLFEDDQKHWIATDPQKKCSAVGLWTGRRLFAVGDGSLAEYCKYEWSAAQSPMQTDIDSLTSQIVMLGGEIDVDRRAITPQADFTTWAHDAFVEGVHRDPQAPGGPPRVRVVVVDNESFDSVGSHVGDSRHGLFLAALIREIACPSQDCSVEVHTEMAMARILDGGVEQKVDNRGDFGRLTDLIDAIERALQRWRDGLFGQPGQVGDFTPRLVFNFSLGFKLLEKASVADRAVYDAFRAISCHGGASFAAAGNDTGGISPEMGLLAPAVWQGEAEPGLADCDTLLGLELHGSLVKQYELATSNHRLHPAFDPAEVAYLIHGVGALDHRGEPIKTSRTHACPRLGALGLGWTVPGEPRAPMISGTSVSSAVVSAIVAATQANDDVLSSPQSYLEPHPQAIVDYVGQSSPRRSFDASGPCAHDAWVCPDEVFWVGGPAVPSPTQNPQGGLPWPALSGLDRSAAADACTDVPHCIRAAASAIATVFPQPNAPPCLKCALQLPSPSSGAIFYAEIGPSVEFVDAVLVVQDGNEVLYPLGNVAPAQCTAIELLPGQSISAGAVAWVSGYDASHNVTTSQPIVVAQ